MQTSGPGAGYSVALGWPMSVIHEASNKSADACVPFTHTDSVEGACLSERSTPSIEAGTFPPGGTSYRSWLRELRDELFRQLRKSAGHLDAELRPRPNPEFAIDVAEDSLDRLRADE